MAKAVKSKCQNSFLQGIPVLKIQFNSNFIPNNNKKFANAYYNLILTKL